MVVDETRSADEGVSGERSISPVRGGSGGFNMQSPTGKGIAMAALLAGAGFLYWATGESAELDEDLVTETSRPVRQVRIYEPATYPPNDPAPEPERRTEPAPAPTPEPEVIYVREEPRRRVNPGPSEAELLLMQSRRAPLMAVSGNDAPGGSAGGQVIPAPEIVQPPEPTELESALRASSTDMNIAANLPNRDLLILAGTILPCILQTAIDTTTPGLVSCVIPRDILSDSGRVVLMEKGTRVLGEYRGGMRQGQERVFVAWNRAVTPTGVAITLDSPASDQLGRSGFDGEIDTNFWPRFGGALLLSVIGDATTYGREIVSDDVTIRETANAANDAAAIALENSINIPPTLRKNQGEEVAIFVANDLNFSDVYDLRRRRHHSYVTKP